jgi:hypothetical protein
MKRILLSILLIGVLLLGACSAPPPPPETPSTPPPAEPEELPLNPSWITSQVGDLNQAMIQLISFDSDYAIHTRVYSEEQGEILVHEFVALAGNWYYTIPVNATALAEAKTHIENAHCLMKYGVLPSEVEAHERSLNEIIREVSSELSEALTLLKLQEESSYSWQEDAAKWITESTSDSPGLPPDLQPNKEKAIQSLSGIFRDYREELSKMINKLELILSRLPSTPSLEG